MIKRVLRKLWKINSILSILFYTLIIQSTIATQYGSDLLYWLMFLSAIIVGSTVLILQKMDHIISCIIKLCEIDRKTTIINGDVNLSNSVDLEKTLYSKESSQ